MLKIGKTIVLNFNSYVICLRQLMGVSPGDEVYALKRGMYFTLMTQEQYKALLARYDAKIEAVSDPLEIKRLVDKRTQISVFKNVYTVSKDGSASIGVDFASSLNLGSQEKLLVHRTEEGYNFWRLNSFKSYFPDGVVFKDDDASSNRRGSSDVRESWCSYNADNSSCIFSVDGVIDYEQERNILLTCKDGFLEIRTASEFDKLISEYGASIRKAVAEDKKELAKLLRVMAKNITDNSVQKRVNSEGRIYIPIEWAHECGFCDKSSAVVFCEINEGVVRIVPAHRYDGYLANRKINDSGKPR